jgi:hypothetical protein
MTERLRDSAWVKIGSSLRDLFGVNTMLKATRWWCVGLLAFGAMLVALAGSNSAQETKEKKPNEKHDGSVLNETLRDVINAGRKMFNDEGDYAGCYRLFQGSLMTVRPFLAADLQKKIDQGMANAEKMGRFDDRAFELRRVLDEIRASLKPAGTTGEKTKEMGQIAGKLMLDGKTVAGGYFVTLVSADGKKFSSAIQKDGSFQFKTPISPGEYIVIVEPIPGEKGPPLPPRYGAEGTSGLSIRVQTGKQQIELNLVK